MTQFTRQAIIQSFLKLLEARPLDKITIRDIVEDCQINRNTFYYHFENIPALVEAIFREETERVLEKHGDIASWEQAFIAAADFALKNKRVIYHIYNSANRGEFERYLNRITSDVMTRFVAQAAAGLRVTEEDKALMASFYRAALTGMILDWLNAGMKYDPAEVVTRLGKMLEGNISASLRRIETAP